MRHLSHYRFDKEKKENKKQTKNFTVWTLVHFILLNENSNWVWLCGFSLLSPGEINPLDNFLIIRQKISLNKTFGKSLKNDKIWRWKNEKGIAIPIFELTIFLKKQ